MMMIATIFAAMLVMAIAQDGELLAQGSKSKSKSMGTPTICSAYKGRALAICVEYCITKICPARTKGNERCKVLRKKFYRKEGTRVFPCDRAATAAPVKPPVTKAPVAPPVTKAPVAPPVIAPSRKPSSQPSGVPSKMPSFNPSKIPTISPNCFK
ncbi:hypothetical protein MPSEU_000163700 [Mayamaea pseudoterrestris]|nr:hypothetical protein MPSEU_000163700 [Mayamaea pseudoterrestris]